MTKTQLSTTCTKARMFSPRIYTRRKIRDHTYLSSQTLITPSSRGMMTAAFTSSLHPSNLDRSTGLRLLLNLSWFTPGAGLISAAISQRRANVNPQTRLSFDSCRSSMLTAARALPKTEDPLHFLQHGDGRTNVVARFMSWFSFRHYLGSYTFLFCATCAEAGL